MPGGLLRDWQLKLTAVVLALALWVFVVGGDRVQVSLATPVEYVGVPPTLMLAGSRDAVDIEVEAPRWALDRVSPGTVRLRVDLASLGEGDSTLQVSPSQVETPPGVHVSRLTPAWIRVSLVAATTRAVPVVPQIRGVPAAGHVIQRVTVTPPSVDVRGPRVALDARVSLETLPVDVSDRREPVATTVGLVTPELLSLVKERSVQVAVEIVPEDAMQRATRGERR